MENMPVEILNLGKKRYVESLFSSGKSHLLRNVIDKVNNDLQKLQLFLRER